MAAKNDTETIIEVPDPEKLTEGSITVSLPGNKSEKFVGGKLLIRVDGSDSLMVFLEHQGKISAIKIYGPGQWLTAIRSPTVGP